MTNPLLTMDSLPPFSQIQPDQVEDYAQRKGMTLVEAERWLGPNLN